MKINNRKEIATAMYSFLLLIFLDLLFLIFARQFINIRQSSVYVIFLVIFVFFVWKIMTLKIFSLEVSDHIFSVKYSHPLFRSRQPALEVPIEKVISLKTEKGIITYILVISINTKRGIRNFYYKIGQLPENQFDKFKNTMDLVKTSYINQRSTLSNPY